MSSIALSTTQTNELKEIFAKAHSQIAQIDSDKRTITARNYSSSIFALGNYLAEIGEDLPTLINLERWRDDMIHGRCLSSSGKQLSVKTVNARLSAVRKLLLSVAATTTDITMKLSLRDWANIQGAKETVIQDKVEEDYGKRLEQVSASELINRPDITNIKGLRDRAAIALGLGAGLRVSEIAKVTIRDVFHTIYQGKPAIHIRRSKHNKTRIVAMGENSEWILDCVRAYCKAIGLDIDKDLSVNIIRGVKPLKNSGYRSDGDSVSTRALMNIFTNPHYFAKYRGEYVSINWHDLRRTYAYLSRKSGMSWDALALNLGHSDYRVTQTYVGDFVETEERMTQWKIQLNS